MTGGGGSSSSSSGVALPTVLTVGSMLGLSLLTFMCLCCRKKSKNQVVIHEENHLYDMQTFQREGSRFAVTRSKTVTRPNQITRELPTAPGETPAAEPPVQITPVPQVEEEQSHYVNVKRSQRRRSSMDAVYVNPIPESDVYQNVDVIAEVENSQTEEEEDNQYDYENIFPPASEDGDDYENSDFLEQVAKQQKEDEDYPDYENAEIQAEMNSHNT